MFSVRKDIFSRTVVYAVLLFLVLFKNAYAQRGEYFVQNFLPKNYEALPNNFGVAQDNNGLMYVANRAGVLVYDGITWERCYLENQTAVYSISKTQAGEIVVGTEDGDVGIIFRNKTGGFQYRSLLENLPDSKKPHEIIRQIATLGGATYFLSSDKLVEYKNGAITTFNPKSSFHARLLLMGRHVFVCEINNHLSVLENNRLVPVEKTEELSKEKYFFCYPITATKFMIGYRNIGTYLATYDSINPAKTKFEKQLSACDLELVPAEVNNGCLLRNGNYIVTTNQKGAFEINKNLEIVYRFNSKNGIYDDNVKSAFQDMNGNLWLALYYGVSFVEINSNIYRYSRNNGINGVVQSATYFDDKLFIATDKGLEVYNNEEEKFYPFQNFSKQTWYLFAHSGKLFIATDKGIHVYWKGNIEQVSGKRTFCLQGDQRRPDVLYAGTDQGLEVYQISKDKISLLTEYNLGREIKSLACDQKNSIYFASTNKEIFFLNSEKSFALDSIKDKSELSPEYFENYVFSYEGKLMLGAYDGIYSLVNTTGTGLKFVKDPLFWPLTKKSQIFRATQFGNNLICYQKYTDSRKNKAVEKITLLRRRAGSDKIKSVKLNHLGDLSPNLITYDSLEKAVFICSNDGLFIITDRKSAEPRNFNLFLHKFGSSAEVLMENCRSGEEITKASLEIPYKSNDVNASFGFTGYQTTSTEFCFLLKGKDNTFTKWSKENKIQVTNLREGNYVLIAKARTELEDKEYVLELPFKILPPWYRTIYAYGFYLFLFAVFVYLMLKLNGRRLVAQNKKLEKTIEERTRTISAQKEEIEHKQMEILDSINYAQRIQKALLASDKMLGENLSDYFVFFQPKDVVSGDFYWATVLPDKQFALVTADSTGHGVPGAIMSVLNMSCLKEAVEAEKLVDPDQILNHTRRKVIQTLANDGSAEGGKDGMDCSLICFNLRNNKISVALANNPIWIVRRDSQNSAASNENALELLELKPDKMPVGKHDRDTVPFAKQDFDLQKGDMIYALTDGFPDQFGGPKGKKFMYKQLKELMVSISQLSLKQQKLELQKTLEAWKGTAEQVDDICIIGVRI